LSYYYYYYFIVVVVVAVAVVVVVVVITIVSDSGLVYQQALVPVSTEPSCWNSVIA